MRTDKLAKAILIAPIVLAVQGVMALPSKDARAQMLALEAAQAKQNPTALKQTGGQSRLEQSRNIETYKIDALTHEQIKELEETAEALYEEGDYAGAINYAEIIFKWEEKYLGPKHPDTLVSLNYLGILYIKKGFHKEAEPLLIGALGISEKELGPEDPGTALSLTNLGYLYDDQGLYAKAEPLYQRALSIYEKTSGSEHSDTATLLNNIALLYLRQGLYKKAEPIFLRVLAINEKLWGPYDSMTALSLNNLGGLYNEQELYDKAEPIYQRAVAIREKELGSEHPETAISLLNLASLYNDQGSYEKAERLGKRALAINDKVLGVEHPDTALILNTLAISYENQGLYTKAEPLYQRALAILEKSFGDEHPFTFTALINLAIFYSEQGLHTKSQSLWRRGQYVETTLIQREAPMMPRDERQNFVDTFGYAYEIIFSGIQNNKIGVELALFSRLNRQGLLEEIEKRQAQLAALPGEQQELALRLRLITQQLSSLSLSNEERVAIREKKEQVERQLYQLLPELKPRVVEVNDVAGVLPKGGVLVEFQRYEPFDGKKKDGEQWGKARYLALVLKENRSIEAVDLGLADLIDRSVEKALIASEKVLPNAEVLWSEVGEMVMQPLARALRGVDTLVISPDGELNRLPFATLPAPGGGSLLAERFKLRLVTTGRELLDLKDPLRNRGKTPLVVANPDFDLVLSSVPGSDVLSGDAASRPAQADAETSVFTERGQLRSAETDQLRWDPLPGTKREGEFVAGLLNGRLLVEQEARSNAVQQAKAPTVLHIASHAFFLPDQEQENNGVSGDDEIRDGLQGDSGLNISALSGESPLLRSGIALAGANRVSQRKSGEEDDDGYLTALEVAQLNWKGTELVVISACESGKGEIKAGEGVYGLKRAIAVSGARSSLLSLWKVDDRATAAFMRSYYEKLKAGLGRAEALSSTQEEFRNHRIPMWRHPYVWAAFQLSGDWRPIELW